MLPVKATIDIPEELYRRVKARSALAGRTVRDVTIELYRRWLGEADPDGSVPRGAWLRGWLDEAEQAIRQAPAGPTARQELERDRGRIDRERASSDA